MSPEKKSWYEVLTNRSGYLIKASFDKIASSDAIEKKVNINVAIDIILFSNVSTFQYDLEIILNSELSIGIPLIKHKLFIYTFKIKIYMKIVYSIYNN